MKIKEIEEKLGSYGVTHKRATSMACSIANWKAQFQKISKQTDSNVIPLETTKEFWNSFSKNHLLPNDQFQIHEYLFNTIYDSTKGGLNYYPAWIPTNEFIKKTNLYNFMQRLSINSYNELYSWSINNYKDFWNEIIKTLGIKFHKQYNSICDIDIHSNSNSDLNSNSNSNSDSDFNLDFDINKQDGPSNQTLEQREKKIQNPNWLNGAKLNIVDSCFRANKDQIAIIYQKFNSSENLDLHQKKNIQIKNKTSTTSNNNTKIKDNIDTLEEKVNSKQNNSTLKKITYGELENLINKIAYSLKQLSPSLEINDAIAIDMPMTYQSIAIYLAIIKAGFKVVSIADSFAENEIKTRLKIADTKLIFTQDYIYRANKKLPLYTKVINANAPTAIVLPGNDIFVDVNLRSNDIAWDDFLLPKQDLLNNKDNYYKKEKYRNKKNNNANYNCENFTSVSRNPHDHINILFSSGTTSTPKAIPWDHTSAIKSASDGHLHQDIRENDRVCWPTNLGWMMGPWLIFATLINKATITLYCDAPTTKDFTKFVENSKTTILGLVPSLVKAWKTNNTLDDVDFTNIKLFSSTGESSNCKDMFWLMAKAGYKPVIEYCGGTEISGGYITSTVIQPNIPSTFSTPALGTKFVIIDEHGNETNNGEIALIPPTLGLSRELLNKNHHEIYYKDMPKLKTNNNLDVSNNNIRNNSSNTTLRRHGDHIQRLDNGYYRALGRTDDTMNLGGIKVGASQIERVIINIENIKEAAAIAICESNGGPCSLIIYAVLIDKANSNLSKDELKQIMQKQINKKLNPLFKIHDVILLDALPRTSSNKIIRRILRDKCV